ncbi:MAG: alpha/beta hydrolase [Gemmataceae bacterium]
MANRRRIRATNLRELMARAMLGHSAGYVAASWTVSRWLTRRAPVRMNRTPAMYGLAWEPLILKTEDDIRLAGWLVEPAAPRGTVALFHGMRGSRLKMLDRLAFLVGEGYRCVSFDHRAHGKSRGRRASFGFFEGRDVVAIRELIRQRWPDQPTAALGVSMGAAALCYASNRVHDWHAVILEGVYRDLDAAFRRRIGSNYPTWFTRLSPGIVRITEKRLRLRMEQMAPIDYVSGLAPTPVLFLVGENDPLAPPGDSQQMYWRYPGPRELWVVPGAGHSDVFETGGEEYRKRVREFLQKMEHRLRDCANPQAMRE